MRCMGTFAAFLSTFLALSLAVGAAAAIAPADERLKGRELRKPLPERVPGQPRQVSGEVSDEVIRRVRTALHETLGVAPRVVDVLVAEEVVWTSGALGCGEPGQQYQPVPVTGQRVVLQADGRRYDYRVAGAVLRLCRSPEAAGTVEVM